MDKMYAACSSCGAIGAVGEVCEFCGNIIEPKPDGRTYSSRIVEKRTIPPDEFARKISCYRDISSFKGGCANVRIGELNGLVNLNGDLVLPLDYKKIIWNSQCAILVGSRRDVKFLNLVEWTFFNPKSREDIDFPHLDDKYADLSVDACFYKEKQKIGENLFIGAASYGASWEEGYEQSKEYRYGEIKEYKYVVAQVYFILNYTERTYMKIYKMPISKSLFKDDNFCVVSFLDTGVVIVGECVYFDAKTGRTYTLNVFDSLPDGYDLSIRLQENNSSLVVKGEVTEPSKNDKRIIKTIEIDVNGDIQSQIDAAVCEIKAEVEKEQAGQKKMEEQKRMDAEQEQEKTTQKRNSTENRKISLGLICFFVIVAFMVFLKLIW